MKIAAVAVMLCVFVFGCGKEDTRKQGDQFLESADDAIEKGDFEEAVVCLEKHLKLDPDAADCYLKLALIHEKISMDKGKARECYRKFLEISDDDVQKKQVEGWLRKLDDDDSTNLVGKSEELLRLVLEYRKEDHEREVRSLKDAHRREIEGLKRRLVEAGVEVEDGERETVLDGGVSGKTASGENAGEIIRLGNEISILKSELNTVKGENAKIAEDLSESEDALKLKESERSKLVGTLSDLEKKYKEAIARIDRLEKEMTDIGKTASEEILRGKVSALETTLETVRVENRMLIQQVKELRAENKQIIAESKKGPATGVAANTGSGTKRDVPGIKEIRKKTIYYSVQQGDTLIKIAEKFYGDKRKWSAIFAANSDHLSNENDIKYGDIIKVPILK